MGNVSYDKTLEFGQLDLTGSATVFPNVIDFNTTRVSRMDIDILAGDAVGGTSLTVIVQGSDSGTGGWVDIGKNTIVLATLKEGKGAVAVSPNNFRYLQVTVTKTGTFTAGTATAQLNTYVGK